MHTTTQFLDAVRARHGLTSDYQLAKFLKIGQPTISGYRRAVAPRHLDDDLAVRVADALGMPPAYVLACVAAERAKSEATRAAWADAAGRLCIMLSRLGVTKPPHRFTAARP